jgi:hypothetical protein
MMARKRTRWLVVSLVCGTILLQGIGAGCSGFVIDTILKVIGISILDQTLGPLLGDPAGDTTFDLANLFGGQDEQADQQE